MFGLEERAASSLFWPAYCFCCTPALVAAAVLSNRYINDRFLPDKAIDLIDEAAATIKVQMESVPTELDNLERLSSQIDDYYKAFDHVAVVTFEKNLLQLQKVLDSIDKPVGIYVLRKNGKLGMIQKPQRYIEDLNKEIIFKLLRKNEYENIITHCYGYLPEVSQFKYYTACKQLFLEIPLEESYLYVLKNLKKRMQLEKQEFVKVPYELKFLAYFMELKYDDYQKLETFLEQQYGGM